MYHLDQDDLRILRQFPAAAFAAAPEYKSAIEGAERLANRGLLVREMNITQRFHPDFAGLKQRYRLSKRAVKLARQNRADNQLSL